MNSHQKLVDLLNAEILPFEIEEPSAYAALAEYIGEAHIVLLGEATHGTAEFYEARARLSQYLIQNQGFHAVAIEGDWTSAYPLHLYLQGEGGRDQPEFALEEFKRFPTWMWRNTVILKLLHELRLYNDSIRQKKVGFYGLDLYCLNDSMQVVVDYLKKYHPQYAQKAIQRYACFDHGALDPHDYSYQVNYGAKKACFNEVTEQLLDMQRLAVANVKNVKEFQFYALQNARLVKNAEHYYRAMFESHEATWNIRDQHMAETLQNLMAFLTAKLKKPAKIIVWAHNSHIGDARATEMSERHEVNLGQLVRERFNISSFSLGFSTYGGTVTAASRWGGAPEIKRINPALSESYEALFHDLKLKNFILPLRKESELTHLLKLSRLQRAIGVIYLPETERMSHYYFARLPYQFDAIIHFNQTHALQ